MKGKIIAYGLLFLIFMAIISLPLAIKIVPEGNVGVKLRGGKAIDELDAGLHLVIPIYEGVEMMSIRTETYTMSSTAGSRAIENDINVQDKISVKTKEGINSNMDISIRYRMEEDRALEVYSRLGTMKQVVEKLVRPTAREEIRTSASRFFINDIYAENRSDFRESVEADIRNDFEEYGFIIEKVQIRDIQLPEKVENAIEEKEEVEQQIEKKQKEIEREKLEKKRKIVEAEGEAEQNRILDRSLTKEVLMNRFIKALGSGDVTVAYIPTEAGMPLMKDVDSNIQTTNTTE